MATNIKATITISMPYADAEIVTAHANLQKGENSSMTQVLKERVESINGIFSPNTTITLEGVELT